MNSFPAVEFAGDISQKRVLELCVSLGKINAGMRCVCLPEGGSGHAIALLLESVIKSSGHCVGRITSAGGFDSRNSIFINGDIPSIEDYNLAVAELKSAVQKNPESRYTKEETTFVLGLLLCRISGCDCVILEGLSGKNFALDAVCAPFDLIVMPTVYDSEKSAEKVKILCDAIRRGTREVVSGNQKSEIYNAISNACAISGVRLYIPVKAQFETGEIASRKMTFSYNGREGFSIKSPSHILRDCAMTVIESALALRRGGVRLPWNCIVSGLSSVSETLCLDILAVSPVLLVDSASGYDEAVLVKKTIDEVFSDNALSEVVFCVPEESLEVLNAFGTMNVSKTVVYSKNGAIAYDGEVICDSVKKAAKSVVACWKNGKDVVCLGSAGFALEIKSEILKLINS